MKKLSRDEMKNVMGGMADPNTCRYHHVSNGVDYYSDLMSKADAQAGAAEVSGKWCCASCPF